MRPYLLNSTAVTGHGITMNSAGGTDIFYGKIPVFRGFTSLMDPKLYSPLPDDWTIGVADIVESTRAIAAQRYKAVNMAGASVIAAVTNALEGREFPFVFGGDGASFAVAPGDLAAAREALAATATWVKEDLDLSMRIALVPVSAVRAQGLDVRVARFGPSTNLSYAMFSGGGLGWADAAMKRGEFAVAAALFPITGSYHLAATIILWAAVVLTYVSGAQYLIDGRGADRIRESRLLGQREGAVRRLALPDLRSGHPPAQQHLQRHARAMTPTPRISGSRPRRQRGVVLFVALISMVR